MIYIIIILSFLFIISFILAYRSLAELEVPREIVDKIKKGEKPPKLWGIIIFLKGRIVHYSSSSDDSAPSSETTSSSSNSSKSSERIDV